MHFALTEEQHELMSAVRGLVDRRATTLSLRDAFHSDAGHDTELWSALCTQIGVTALAVPEDLGGAGFSSFETHLVLEALGETLTPTPLLGSGVLTTQAVLLAGDRASQERLLPRLAQGTTGALAWAGRDGRWSTDTSDVTATQEGDGWRLDGEATVALDAGDAEILLVVARTPEGLGLFEVDPEAPSVVISPTPALDPTMHLASVSVAGCAARPLSLSAVEAFQQLRASAAVAVTALQVGGARSALDRTVAHLTEREQFGRPLGSFQALKHRVADLLVQVETARSISWAAAWAVATDAPDLRRQAAIAKAWCSDAFEMVASEMVQLHGGIAITWEHDAQLFFKRAHATAQLFGPAHEHRRRLL